MDPHLFLLALTVAGASALQSATGIGFGVIAGPVLLLAMNSGAAIQISIALSLLIALVLAPSLRTHLDRGLLARLLIGTGVGLPAGLAVFLSVELEILKLLAGLAVLFTLGLVFRTGRACPAEGGRPGMRWEAYSMGVVSGAMSGSLAMPGPVPAAWMTARSYGKDTIRATILAMFVVSYLAALGLQAALAGISTQTLWVCGVLALPTLAGVWIGRGIAAHLTERVFRWILIAVLAATTAGLFADAASTLAGQ